MAKIIHLGDLHLGIKFHKRSLIDDQRHVLNQVIEWVDREKACTVIAGDIFDTVNPSIEAQELWFEFLDRLGEKNQHYGLSTFIIPGNHDSAARLSLGRTFMESYHIHIVDKNTPYQIFTLLDGTTLWCVPFTKPSTLEARFHKSVDTFDEAYSELLSIIGESNPITENTVLVAHQTFEGGRMGESEFKPFMSDAVSLGVVRKFPLVLAGHLHECQHLGNVHYCGSLLPYAFGDDYNQGISLWENETAESEWVHSRLPITIKHPLAVVTGDLASCLKADVGSCYVKVKLTGCLHFEEALSQLQEHFPLLLCVTNDSADKWVADLDKPISAFGSIQEALDAFCDHLEIPRFEGTRKKLIQEALDAFNQNEN